MNLKIADTEIEDVKVISADLFADDRGIFSELWRADQFVLPPIVQMNYSTSKKGVLRGLHVQWDPPMGKLMRVASGIAQLVAVDLRHSSPTYGKHVSRIFSEGELLWLWAPAHFARGFYAIESCSIEYLCTGVHNGNAEAAIRWNDSDLDVKWNILTTPQVSKKDNTALSFKEFTTTHSDGIFA